MTSIGKRIKEIRTDAKLNQIDFAKVLNLDKSTVAKYETEKALPSINVIIEIAKKFKVKTDYILGLED